MAAPAATAARPTSWTAGHNWILFLTIVAFVAVPFVSRGFSRLPIWGAIASLLLLFVLVAGHGYNGLLRGALVDSQNRISLSRLQLVVWTVLVLSAYTAMSLWNLGQGDSDPLSIAIPQDVWVLLGISTTSLVGTGLIQSNKKNEPTNQTELARNADLLDIDPAKVTAQGQLVAKKSPKDASWADLFEGEETGNWATLDIAKIQMFFFTLVLVLAYAVALAAKFNGTEATLHGFPPFSDSMLALLAISHAGYLANKAVPHTPRTP